MSNKLVYNSGVAYWKTPEGSFVAAEMHNGMPVEHVVMKKK